MGGAIRSYYLAKALVDRGIETVVITGCNEVTYRNENLEGIEVHYLPVAYENAFGFLKRSLSFLSYVWKSYRLAKKIPDVNIVYAISTPLTVGLVAMRLKKRLKLPYIFEVGDLWPDAPIQMGFIKNKIFASLLYKLEKVIYKNADSIVALSESIKNAVQQKISSKQIHIIPNFSDCDFYQPEKKNPMLRKKYSVEGKFVVSYIGAIGAANGLDYFIECANTSQKADLPVHFFLCGEGAMLDQLKASITNLNLKNISVIGFVGRDEVRDILNITDASFICYKNVPILQTGSPNKYFDSLAGGKLIVNNFGGWIKEEIAREQCGISIDPFHPTDFIKKTEPFLKDSKLLLEFQARSRSLAERKYDRKKLSDDFASIFLKGL
jgi:glycosyltransferase involved in cell wall biosynthesis